MYLICRFNYYFISVPETFKVVEPLAIGMLLKVAVKKTVNRTVLWYEL